MTDAIPLFIGLGIGLILGGLLVGLWVSGRMRAQTQRAEAIADEVRKQLELEWTAMLSLREELSQTQQARVVAETRLDAAARHVTEQKVLLDQTRQELVGSFQALSGEALKQNNEAFLKLAVVTFETLHVKADGDLVQRQQAIDALVRPLHDTLQRYDEQLRLLEQSRQTAYGGLDQHLKSLAESQQKLQQETGNLVKALRAPTVRGQWGELTLKRVAELAGMVEHCDFIEQYSVTGEDARFRPDMVVQLPAAARSSLMRKPFSRLILMPTRRRTTSNKPKPCAAMPHR
ncbi:MAG: DNA recombination protein RmuC [Nitrospira sp.]|nr:DNA recombination protein RmuC [Nitrospira sp.]